MTLGVLAVTWCAGAAALFDAFTVDLQDSRARVFLAKADADDTADIFVLTGRYLTAYSTARGGEACCHVAFEEGTSAFDVADLDGDGQNEIVAVCGDRLVKYDLEMEPNAPTVLFEHHTLLSDAASDPYPHVVVVEHDAKAYLALPLEDFVELRSPDGTFESRYTIKDASDQDLFVLVARASRLGPPDAIEISLSRKIDLSQGLPEELGSPEPIALRHRRYQRADAAYRAARNEEYEDWPWFPLKTDWGVGTRVLFAKPKFDRTLIRIYEGPPNAVWTRAEWYSGEGVKVSPAKQYPGGIVVTPEDLPDFNGDGYVDLVLCSAPEPKLSVGSVTRVITGGSWPLHVTVHLFSPEENRYEAKPFGKVSSRVPPVWFLVTEQGVPIRNCVLRDFNGDGLSDCGWSVAENEFDVWLCNDANGFAEKPDWTYTFPEEGVAREFAAPLSADGKQVGTSVAFRGEKKLYVFVAGS